MPLLAEQLQQLQDGYQAEVVGHKSRFSMDPETIIVGVRLLEEESELISWAVHTAARPGDSIIALHVQCTQEPAYSEEDAEERPLRLAKDVAKSALIKMLDPYLHHCAQKQIKVEARIAGGVSVEKVLVEQADALRATLLLLGSSGRPRPSWCHQSPAIYCSDHAPPRCSVLVVKDNKVLAYKGSTDNTFFPEALPKQKPTKSVAGSRGSLPRRFKFCAQEPDVLPTPLDSPTRDGKDAANQAWELEGLSPRGVLEGTVESESSSPPSSITMFSPSLSKRPFLAAEEDALQPLPPPQRPLSTVWKNPIRRLHSFPSSHRVKKLLANSSCHSARTNSESGADSGAEDGEQAWDGKPPNSRPPWRSFTYNEISMATRSFDHANLVGKGGYAQVFKGILPNGEVIAVKLLTRESEELKERDFLTELGIIGHVCHRNTSMLIGFCIEGGLHLVYKYSPHGSLASVLHAGNGSSMDWAARYKVAVGVAHGLHYLHKRCPRRIIHRDIKSSNILLGPDFEPQISDFGLAKWLPEQWTHHTVEPVEGTIGYLAPEYFMHGIVDEKTDVFAYGVVLLELISGRRPVDATSQNLVMWAKPLLEATNLPELVDRSLGTSFDASQMRKLIMVATLCVRHSAIWRPSMKQVLDLLTEDATDSDAVESEELNQLVNKSLGQEITNLESDYSIATYQKDLCRHRELALCF